MLRESHNFEEAQPQESSPKRLMMAVETALKLQVGEMEVKGKDHLKEIPIGRKVIVATSHSSDLDMPIAIAALGHDLDLAIVDMSVHHSFKDEAPSYLGLLAAGKENFIPIDFSKDKQTGQKRSKAFNPKNFEPMVEALQKGKRVMIAAHNPSENIESGRAGYGAAYLAEMNDAVILPIAVSLEADKNIGTYGNELKTFLNKPSASVTIGAPFELQKIPDFQQIQNILLKRGRGEKLDKEEVAKFSELKNLLQEQSQYLMSRVAELQK